MTGITARKKERAARKPPSVAMAEITYRTWTADNLLRHTVYVGLREDKRAEECGEKSHGLVGGSGQGSINQRQSGVDVERPFRIVSYFTPRRTRRRAAEGSATLSRRGA